MRDNRIDYSIYRLDKAKEDLDSAKLLFANHSYYGANNRAYYCVFHAMRSVLALDGYDSKKHSGVISKFREMYIKTGILPVNISDAIKETYEVRQDSDYGDMYETSKDESEEQIRHAEYVYKEIETYLQGRWNELRLDSQSEKEK